MHLNTLRFSTRKSTPLVLQSEAAECGLACIAMIAQHYGDSRDMTQLRQHTSVSLRGVTLMDVMHIADDLGLQSRALKIELNELTQLRCPAILHWDMQHFVVLTRCTNTTITIHDPAYGKRTLPIKEASDHVTGVALEVTPNDTFKPVTSAPTLSLRDFFSRTLGFKRNLLTLLALSIVIQVFSLASPYYMQTVIDDVLLRNNTALLVALAVGFGLLLLMDVITNIVRRFLILTLSTRLQLQLTASVFKHLLSLPLDYFAKRHVGDLVSRFGSLANIREFLTTSLVTALLDGLMAVITLAVMAVYSTTLTWVVLGVMTIYLTLRIALLPLMQRLTTERISLAATEQSHFMESMRGILPIRVYQQEVKRHGQWQNKLVATLNKDVNLGKVGVGNAAANQLLFGIENIVVVYIAASMVMDNAMTIGMMLAFIAYKTRFSSALDNLVNTFIELNMLGVHLSRLSDIVFTAPDKRPLVHDTPTAPHSDTTHSATSNKHVITENLAYRYGDHCPTVFENINLTVNRGEFIAIVGASGSGKSTFLKCLMGLYAPSSGAVEHIGSPRRPRVASVLQEDMCLSGTIADNISCFDENVDHKRLFDVAQLACIHNEITAMPMQYHTLVGDMGSSLSGGQKQRLLLARALYQQPDILFLDEASSHLDVENERHINRHLKALNITRIMVAHRPQTIAQADTVYQLSQGNLHRLEPTPTTNTVANNALQNSTGETR